MVISNNPTNDTDATNKRYVDTLFNRRVLTSNISPRQQVQYQAQNGYEIVNMIVGRKRSRDGFIFFQYNESLNYQFFMHPNGL